MSTDWSPPSTFALHRIPDTRARQYWDPNHVLAKKLAADKRKPQPDEECCQRDGILWDLAAVYPPGATWSDRLPPAVLFNGPVVDVKSEIESSLVAGPRGVAGGSLSSLPPSAITLVASGAATSRGFRF